MKYLVRLLIAVSILLVVGSSAKAEDEELDRYSALLSEQDHYSSDGQKLTNAADIIRQDRANYYKFKKRDDFDEADEYFKDEKMRAQIAELMRKADIDPKILRAIENGTPKVTVTLVRGKAGLYLDIMLF